VVLAREREQSLLLAALQPVVSVQVQPLAALVRERGQPPVASPRERQRGALPPARSLVLAQQALAQQASP
jgi:hypothetical protein